MNKMYHYYKGPKKIERWRVTPSENIAKIAERPDVAFISVLACSEAVDHTGSVSQEAKYQGPFYLDIDDQSLSKSLRAAKTTLTKLGKLGVQDSDISIWASGAKGFHLTVPQAVFTEDVPISKLPLAYKFLALSLSLPDEVDMTVYSLGRGRMWRLANKFRPEHGTYKVPISPAELRDLDVKGLKELMSQPRDIERSAAEPKRISKLEGLFNLAMGKAKAVAALKPIFVDPELSAELKDTVLPPCALLLKEGKSLRPGKGFNDLSMQFAKAVVAFAPGKRLELIREFSANCPGESYNTREKREAHCMSAFRVASRSASYAWSCKSILSVLETQPCATCPVASLKLMQEPGYKEPPEDVKRVRVTSKGSSVVVGDSQPAQEPREPAEELFKEPSKEPPSDDLSSFHAVGLVLTDEGYAFIEGGAYRRICNFTLKLTKYYVEMNEALQEDRRTGVQADVIVGRESVGSVVLEESSWSKTAFINSFSGLGNCAFYGKDDDVQKMKEALMYNVSETAELVRRVHSAGIHRQEILGESHFTYVEPGWSIDAFGNENKYMVVGTLGISPGLRDVPLPEYGDLDVQETLRSIMKINSPLNIAQMFAWVMACFIKQHVFAYRKEFPLLGVHGNRGSGKTKGLEMLCELHGISYHSYVDPVNTATSTPFVMWNTMSSYTTFPIIMDEYNKSKMRRNVYDSHGELFKDAWQGGSIQRGTLDYNRGAGASKSGAKTQEFKLSAPIAITSEQRLELPALVQRTVQVSVKPSDLRLEEVTKGYAHVRRNWPHLKTFAKAAYMHAITVSVDQVRDWQERYERKMDIALGDRPVLSYSVLLAGLEFFRTLCEKHGWALDAEAKAMMKLILDHLAENGAQIVEDKNRSETDLVIEKIALLAAMPDQGAFSLRLSSGVHYVCTDGFLYLDGAMCFSHYQRHSAQVDRQTPAISTFTSFRDLIVNEPYCVSINERIPGFANGRPLLKLKISGLRDKGIETLSFEGASL